MSNKNELEYMLLTLNEWSAALTGENARRAMAKSEFDFLQEQFLRKRHQLDKNMQTLQKQGITTKTATLGQEIRDGMEKLKATLEKLKQQLRRITKKKKQSPQILDKKAKIVENCQLLYQDLQDKQNGADDDHYYQAKPTTLTDLKARLLCEIDEKTNEIHQNTSSDGKLSEVHQDELNAMKQYQKMDQKMDEGLDVINDKLDGINIKVKNINKQQDIIQEKTQKVGKKIGSTTVRLENTTNFLKTVIKDYKPTNCWLYVALILLIIGLVVIAVRMIVYG